MRWAPRPAWASGSARWPRKKAVGRSARCRSTPPPADRGATLGLAQPSRAWFNPVAAFLGEAYLRQAFTMGTDQEVAFLVEELGLAPGHRVLDVGCGPGRHALALARHGCTVVGVDLSPEFVALARAAAGGAALPATFGVLDVRDLEFHEEFDVAVCLCQGGFGLLGGVDDEVVIARMASAVRPGGHLVVTAFSAYFALRFLEADEHFDPTTGVVYERATVRGDGGIEQVFDLWTTCFTVRELRLLAEQAGLEMLGIHGVRPGAYRHGPLGTDDPELLLVARRPG